MARKHTDALPRSGTTEQGLPKDVTNCLSVQIHSSVAHRQDTYVQCGVSWSTVRKNVFDADISRATVEATGRIYDLYAATIQYLLILHPCSIQQYCCWVHSEDNVPSRALLARAIAAVSPHLRRRMAHPATRRMAPIQNERLSGVARQSSM